MALEPGRSIADVLKDIVGNVQQLIRAELRLARTEIREEVGKASRGITVIAIGGVTAVLGLGLFMLAAVYALALVVPSWAAALIVAVVAVLTAGVMIATGVQHLKQVTLPPPKTVATLQENLQWAKTQAK